MESSGPAIERKSIVSTVSFSTFINRDSLYIHTDGKGRGSKEVEANENPSNIRKTEGETKQRRILLYLTKKSVLKLTITSPLAVCYRCTEPRAHTYYARRCACISIYLDATAKLFVILIQASATLAPLQRADCSTVLFPNVCVSLFFLGTVYSSPPPFTPLGRGTRV